MGGSSISMSFDAWVLQQSISIRFRSFSIPIDFDSISVRSDAVSIRIDFDSVRVRFDSMSVNCLFIADKIEVLDISLIIIKSPLCTKCPIYGYGKLVFKPVRTSIQKMRPFHIAFVNSSRFNITLTLL